MNKLALAIGSFAVAATGILAAGDEPYLLEDLSVWLRADKGLSTNSVGGVTAWANQGTLGAAVDVAPHTDNSAGHVAYEASGIGGKPSLAFDGSVYLKTDAATDLGMTADGGAWFVVYKTPCTRTERANMAIMGSNYNNGGIRFGSFFANNGNEQSFNYFFSDVGATTITSNATEIACSMLWKENGTSYGYPMVGHTVGTTATQSPQAYSAVFMVGNMIPSWMPTFKGEIAEIRIYNRPLTGRECMAVQFELFARYGVSYGAISDEGLSWHENSAQLGYCANDGLPEAIPVSATAGGATVAFDETLSESAYTRSYMACNGLDGSGRMWYVFAPDAARSLPMTFSIDANAVTGTGALILRYSESSSGPWSRAGTCDNAVSGEYRFAFPANGLKSGFYRVEWSQPFTIVIR